MAFESYIKLSDKVEKLEKDFTALKEKTLIYAFEEISLHRAAKVLKRSPAGLIEDIKAGKLQALKDEDKEGVKYRFTWEMIKQYQTRRSVNTPKEIRRHEISRNQSPLDRQIRNIINNQGVL